jgi:hypothetical protein
VDVLIPTISADEEAEFVDDTDRSFHTGMALARWIRRERPHLPVVGLLVAMNRELREWFIRNCSGFASKLEVRDPDQFVRFVRRSTGEAPTAVRTFIVHGHDEQSKLDLKNYLQNTLGLPEPIVLHEQPSQGRTALIFPQTSRVWST